MWRADNFLLVWILDTTFLLCQETWNCRQSQEVTKIAISWEIISSCHFRTMTTMHQKMEMKSFSIAVLVAEDAQHASWRRAGERDVAFQQCSLWRTYVVVDDKRRKLVNPFILFLLLPFLGRQSVKLAACLTKSLCFSVSLQTQLCDVGLFSDELTLFCFSDCHLLSTQPVFQISLSAHLTFFSPSALNCCCGLQDLNSWQLCYC